MPEHPVKHAEFSKKEIKRKKTRRSLSTADEKPHTTERLFRTHK